MKALSLTQPWATAMAIGIKEWETRSWPTSLRGRVQFTRQRLSGMGEEFARKPIAIIPVFREKSASSLWER